MGLPPRASVPIVQSRPFTSPEIRKCNRNPYETSLSWSLGGKYSSNNSLLNNFELYPNRWPVVSNTYAPHRIHDKAGEVEKRYEIWCATTRIVQDRSFRCFIPTYFLSFTTENLYSHRHWVRHWIIAFLASARSIRVLRRLWCLTLFLCKGSVSCENKTRDLQVMREQVN